MTTLTVRPLSSAIGAEISGVDLSRDVNDIVIGEIRQALLDHCVIFFREQEIDTEQHKRLAKRFGDIFIHPNFNTGDHDPEVVTIHRKPDDELIVGEDWHTDTTMMAEPPMGALLYALDVPEFGGDTLFANQYLAYESLSDGMKELLGGMRCIHTDRKVAGPDSRRQIQTVDRCPPRRRMVRDEEQPSGDSHTSRDGPEVSFREPLLFGRVRRDDRRRKRTAAQLADGLGPSPGDYVPFSLGKGLTRLLGQSLRQTHRRP